MLNEFSAIPANDHQISMKLLMFRRVGIVNATGYSLLLTPCVLSAMILFLSIKLRIDKTRNPYFHLKLKFQNQKLLFDLKCNQVFVYNLRRQTDTIFLKEIFRM